ncbi:MAG: SURF1 family protein [Pseudomonadota bacterium]|nr:SURF1 family protein [Pseudomonadota bacterium]
MQRDRVERQALPPLGTAELPRSPSAVEPTLQRRVRLSGRWLAPRTVFLDNRQMDGKPGFYVVTPLLLGTADGADAVLVQRGWAPRNFAERAALPAFETATGVVSIDGRIAASPSRMFEFASQASGAIRQNIDRDAFAHETQLDLLPVTVVQIDTPGARPDGLSRHWTEPAVDVQKHYGYAVQWFAIAVLIGALYVRHRFLRPRHSH